MNKGSIAKTFVSESGKKTKNRKNGKTSSTDIDSNSQKNDSHSNSKKKNHINRNIKTGISSHSMRSITPGAMWSGSKWVIS